MKYRRMSLRPWINPVDTYLMDKNSMLDEKDPNIQDVYVKSNYYADVNKKKIPIFHKSKILRRLVWKLAFNKKVRTYEKKLKYFSKKDGWDQYWDILDMKLHDEDLYIHAMHSADGFAAKHLKYKGPVWNFLFYSLPWKIVFNKYLKEN